MRNILNINQNWLFYKGVKEITPELEGEQVSLPHTWNNLDGQDGGGDYFRGTCLYAKTLVKSELPVSDQYYLEFRGANSSADVYVNGQHLAHHDGGYSTWRVNITEVLTEETKLVVAVDNSPNQKVYPQVADFTFYGGLYRDVNIVCVNKTHFDLDYYGAPGVKVTPTVEDKNAKVEVEVYTTELKENHSLVYTVLDAEGKEVGKIETKEKVVSFDIENVHLWHGKKDPYLYSCKVEIKDEKEVLDNVSTRFGVRTFKIDPNNGFILNGEEYPLRGVSRHQDRKAIGNALLKEHHDEDIALILEMGATTIRLAHYQHDQYFYDLCDEKGLVIWAEIPYISNHMPGGRENTISQMKELISQNYNHPSIVVWGLSNEITMNGADDPDLLKNHYILNDLCHEMDKTRLTTIAAVSPAPINCEYIKIPDVVSYNHYFGWYGGETSDNGPWFDNFHKTHPNIPIGCSEYGCEALDWHTSNPTQGDYTEEYQSYYHEELIKTLFSRKWMWATHVWNMFDFAADARAEGGENGMNHKGLVTFDRKYKKDSFYAYKAWLSDEPFVHVCSKRYIDRVEDVTKVTVYSNQKEVELFVNGVSMGKKEAEDHFFKWEVPNVGESVIVAKSGELEDSSNIRKVDTFNEAYRLKEVGAVLNWFDIVEKEGRLSLNSKFGDVMASLRGKVFALGFFLQVKKKMDASKKAQEKGKEKKEGFSASGFKMSKDMMKMVYSFTVLRLTSMMGMLNISFTKEELLKLNKKMLRIKAPKKK